MSEFSCEDCDKTFTTKQSLNYHIRNGVCHKKPSNQCGICGKIFASRSGVSRHKKKCNVLPDDDDVDMFDNFNYNDDDLDAMSKKEMRKILLRQKEMSEMKESVRTRSNDSEKNINGPVTINKNVKNVKNVNNVNNGTINVSNVYLVGYGKENIGDLGYDELLKVYKKGFLSTCELIDKVHFNPKYPENRNVYISNMKTKYAMIYNGNNWEMVTKDYLIQKLYNDKRYYIEDNLDTFYNSLLPSQQRALHRWLNMDEDSPENMKIKEDIKLLLYNKRGEAMKIKRQMTSNDNYGQLTSSGETNSISKTSITMIDDDNKDEPEKTEPIKVIKTAKAAKTTKTAKAAKTTQPTKPAKKQNKVITRRCIVNPDALTNRQRAEMSKYKTPKHQPSDTESDEASDAESYASSDASSDAADDTVSEPAEISNLDEEIQQPNIRSQQKRDKNNDRNKGKDNVKVYRAGPRRAVRFRK